MKRFARTMKVSISRRNVIKLVTGVTLGAAGALGVGTPAQVTPGNRLLTPEEVASR